MIPCQRHLFHIPDDIAYLNCAYLSPQLKSVTEAGKDGVIRKTYPWKISPKDFFDESEEVRALFAQLIDAHPDDIAIIPAVSYGMAIAAANLEVNAGESIVVLEEQFPSNVYPWRELVRDRGGILVTVPRPEDGDWTTAVLSAIDERTAIVAVPRCHWTDGSIVDAQTIRARCRSVGASLVLDGAQSLGALPLSVKDIQPDYMVTIAYKWLLGPYSLGFVYIAPDYQQGRPLENNWINRLGSEDFAGLVNYRDEFQPGARRFDVGERSNFVLMPMALAALRQITKWEVPRIAETLERLTTEISQRARNLGFVVAPSHLRAGHLLGLRFPGGLPEELSALLAQEKVYVSVRGDCVRVAPHLYNTHEDIDRLFDVLETVFKR